MVLFILAAILFFLLFGWMGIFVVGGLFAEFFWYIVFLFVGMCVFVFLATGLISAIWGLPDENNSDDYDKDEHGNLTAKSTRAMLIEGMTGKKKPKK